MVFLICPEDVTIIPEDGTDVEYIKIGMDLSFFYQ